MKKISLLIAALVLMASCNNKPKTATTVAETTAPQQTQVTTANKQFSPEDYQLFIGASFENQDSIVKAKIEEGIEVNYTDEYRNTALMMAAYNGHTKVVKMLIDAGANVRMKNVNNRTALMLASSGPFVETVKLLLQSGAEVNAMDSHESWTPLMFAAGEGQMEVAKVLLAAGADITMVDIDGESSYDFAIANNHQAMAAFLKKVAQAKK